MEKLQKLSETLLRKKEDKEKARQKRKEEAQKLKEQRIIEEKAEKERLARDLKKLLEEA